MGSNVVSVWSEVLVDLSEIDDNSLIEELVARGYEVHNGDEYDYADTETYDPEDDMTYDEEDLSGGMGHA